LTSRSQAGDLDGRLLRDSLLMEFMMKYQPALALVFALGACVATPPVASDFNGDSVKIADFASGKTPENTAEAERICKAGGKRRAEYASSMYNPATYQSTHLFLCL
jgi:hypothetical protein